MVPKTGSMGFKSGITCPNELETCLTKNPNIKRRITEGILVLDEVMSKTYANKSKIESVIIIAIDINYAAKYGNKRVSKLYNPGFLVFRFCATKIAPLPNASREILS